MTATPAQSYANHRRSFALYHDVALEQLLGLRLAGDVELPALVERCLRGELTTADAVKREIREWRPDLLRA